MDNNKNKRFLSAQDILKSKGFMDQRTKSAKYISKEFQDFGYRLAVSLDDISHKALYIKLAKKEERNLLQKALMFAKDYPKAKNKGKIFMWKLKELKQNMRNDKKKEQIGEQGTFLF
jgi:hypothetical protein